METNEKYTEGIKQEESYKINKEEIGNAKETEKNRLTKRMMDTSRSPATIALLGLGGLC